MRPSATEFAELNEFLLPLLKIRDAIKNGYTTGDIAKLTGLRADAIRRMSSRGEFPEPAFHGKWRYWDRDEIDSWWQATAKKH